MRVAYSDSLTNLGVVHVRAKPVLHEPNSTEHCFIIEKAHAGLDDFVNFLLPCFRKRMSERNMSSRSSVVLQRDKTASLAPLQIAPSIVSVGSFRRRFTHFMPRHREDAAANAALV